LEVEGVEAGVLGAGEVRLGAIADMGGLAGREGHFLEGEAEDAGIGFGGSCAAGGDDALEIGGETEASEDGNEALIEVGDDGEAGQGGGAVEEIEGIGEEEPDIRGGVVVIEAVEAGGEGLGPGEGGGLRARGQKGGPDDVAPAGVFGVVAGFVGGVIRIVGGEGPGEGMEEGAGLQREAVGPKMPGVDLADRLGGLDEGADGIDKEGLEHGASGFWIVYLGFCIDLARYEIGMVRFGADRGVDRL